MGRLTIDGYADELSYVAGETVQLCCSTRCPTFSVEMARVGGTREIVWRDHDVAGELHAVPERASEVGCGWPASVELIVPESWRSGYYEVVLRARDEATGRSEESLAFFVVRHSGQHPAQGTDAAGPGHQHVQRLQRLGRPEPLHRGCPRLVPTAPWRRASCASPSRTFATRTSTTSSDPEHERFRSWADLHGLARWSGSSGWYSWERLFVQWAERAGYAVDVAVNADLEHRPGGRRRLSARCQRRTRRVLVVGDARHRGVLRRRRRQHRLPLRQLRLLAGALRGRRTHDGLPTRTTVSRRPALRHRSAAPGVDALVLLRSWVDPRTSSRASASRAVATSGWATPSRGDRRRTPRGVPTTGCSPAATCTTATCSGPRTGSRSTRSTAASSPCPTGGRAAGAHRP